MPRYTPDRGLAEARPLLITRHDRSDRLGTRFGKLTSAICPAKKSTGTSIVAGSSPARPHRIRRDCEHLAVAVTQCERDENATAPYRSCNSPWPRQPAAPYVPVAGTRAQHLVHRLLFGAS
jgi:hypothetical protein